MSTKKRTNNGSTTNTYYANAETVFKTKYIGTTYSPPNFEIIPIGGNNRVNFLVDCNQLSNIVSLVNVKLRLKKFGGTVNNIYLTSETSLTSTVNNILEDYAVVEAADSDYCEVDLTQYLFTSTSVLKPGTIYFGLYSETETLTVCLSGSNTESRPELVVEYIDECQGLTNTKTVGGSAGRALNYSVNVRTGRLTFTKPLLNINTLALPINLRLYFDPSLKDITSGYMPKGWRFNYQQKLVSNSEGYEYIDGNGIHHQFVSAKDNLVVYYDVSGTGLVLTKYFYHYVLEDGQNNQLTFDSLGKLTKVVHKHNGNEYGLEFIYEVTTDNISSIRKYTKYSSSTSSSSSEVVKIKYNTGGTGFTITSNGFPIVTATIDDNYNLLNIEEEDSRVSSYTYDLNGMLVSALSDNGEKSVFTYNSNYQVLTIIDCVNDEANILSKLTFDYKYLSTHITNYFGVKKGYSFTSEGELIGEYEINSSDRYVNINTIEKANEYVKIAASTNGNSAGYTDVVIAGNCTQAQSKSSDYDLELSVGDFTPNNTKYFQLSFTYKFTGGKVTGSSDTSSYIVVLQDGVEVSRVDLEHNKYIETFGSLIFKCNSGSALNVKVHHNYDARNLHVKNITIRQIDLIQNFVCTNYQTTEVSTENVFEIDSTNYYGYIGEAFTCDVLDESDELKMYYSDLVGNQENIALNPSSFHIWYNKKRGLIANASTARINVYIEGEKQSISLEQLKVASITVTDKHHFLSYSDYSSNEAFRVDYSKVMFEKDGEKVTETLSKTFVDNNFQAFQTIDNRGIINYKTFNSYGFITSESLKNINDSKYITTNYTYGSNLQLQSESTTINGSSYKVSYETDNYTGRIKKITYPNYLSEEITEITGTINKLKKVSASVNGINSNELLYTKDLIKYYKEPTGTLELVYDKYNLPKRFLNSSNYFWTIEREYDTNGLNQKIEYGYGSFYRHNLYDCYGNLCEVKESSDDANYTSVLQLFYSDLDANNVSQSSPFDSTLIKKMGSKLRKKNDNISGNVTKYFYENNGYVSKETHSNTQFNPQEITYTFDDLNRFSSKQAVLSNANVFSDGVVYKNDYNNEVEGYIVGILDNPATFLSAIITYEKDSIGRVVSENTTIGSNVFKKEYTYQSSGSKTNHLISQMVVTRNGVTLETYNYTYDNMGRITNIRNTSGSVNNCYKYDLLGRLLREDNKELDTTTLFEYDTNGNMLQKSVAKYTTSDAVTPYASPAFTVSSTYADYITSYDGKSIATSTIGNITSVGTTTYSWTRAKLLSRVQKSTNEYVNYGYDGEGLRIKKEYFKNGTTTTHVYVMDGRKILTETITDGNTENVLKYLYFGDNVIGFVYKKTYYHFQKNLQNDIIAIYNESGTKVAAYEYDAWGNHIITLDTNSIGSLNPFRYRGYYYDEETNLFLIGTRYYNSSLARFIQPAKLSSLAPSNVNGLNLYIYCGNSPVNIVCHSDEKNMTDVKYLPSGYVADDYTNFVSTACKLLNSFYVISEVFESFDFYSGLTSGFADGAFKFLLPNGFKSLKAFSSFVDNFGKMMIIAGSFLSFAGSTINNFNNPNYSLFESIIATDLDLRYYTLKGIGTYLAGDLVGKLALTGGTWAAFNVLGATAFGFTIGFTGAFIVGALVGAVIGVTGAFVIYVLGEILDYGWEEFKKILFE